MPENRGTPPSDSGREPGPPAAGNVVLLVSNDRDVAAIWAYSLRQMELTCTLVESAAEARDQWYRDPADLVVIDVCGPDLDGIELTRWLRGQAVNPIVLFTPDREEQYTLEAYRAGVDECVVKPVSPSLFQAKVRAWLRRSWAIPVRALASLELGPMRLDPARQVVSRSGDPAVRLTNLEFRVLYLLMSHEGEVLPAELVVERVWSYAGHANTDLLKNVVYRLRRKIEPDPNHPRYLQTVGRQGYVFQAN